MLKKEETLKGAVVEIFQIKKGVAGYSGESAQNPDDQYVLLTASAGSALSGGHGLPVGSRLEIIDGPKRRGGINTAIVKYKDDDRELEGHVYWCELRASCRLVEASPLADSTQQVRKAKKKPGEFSEKQLARLPEHGYWAEIYNNQPTSFICVKNGAVKYTRPGHEGWHTLLWSCCPTAKQIAGSPDDFRFFKDHGALIAAYPDLEGGFKEPAPNDR